MKFLEFYNGNAGNPPKQLFEGVLDTIWETSRFDLKQDIKKVHDAYNALVKSLVAQAQLMGNSDIERSVYGECAEKLHAINLTLLAKLDANNG